MLPSEMWIQKVCKLWDTDGSHLLHLCFDNITEYDPDVVSDKSAIFSAFCSKTLAVAGNFFQKRWQGKS